MLKMCKKIKKKLYIDYFYCYNLLMNRDDEVVSL